MQFYLFFSLNTLKISLCCFLSLIIFAGKPVTLRIVLPCMLMCHFSVAASKIFFWFSAV